MPDQEFELRLCSQSDPQLENLEDRTPAGYSLEYICLIGSYNLGLVQARLVEEELVHMLLVEEGRHIHLVGGERHIHLVGEDSHPELVVVDTLLPVASRRLANTQYVTINQPKSTNISIASILLVR